MNKQIIHDALVLTAFTLVIGVILGAVYGITKTPIDKANEQTKKEAYQAVFADASGFNQQEYDADAADKMVADAGYDDTIDDVEQAICHYRYRKRRKPGKYYIFRWYQE